ncbi:PilZ domain-containing protein [Paraclostridium benzoelyticum]|uniref:PilZ domain-containing protein n=1 Tax=Paraclostridium benzoelyticum TaxID=1629550 RepID=UPI0031CD061F
MFNLFSKKSEKNLEKSIVRYEERLKCMDLSIRTLYKGRIYTSYVESIKDKEIIFRCPTDQYEIVRFENKRTIQVDLINKIELFKTKILITEKIIREDISFYKGLIISPIEKKERRKNHRLPIIIDCKFKTEELKNIEYDANTLNLSCSGMLMETYEDMPINKKIELKIDIDGKLYNIQSEIIKKRSNYGSGNYLYNLKFYNFKTRHRNEISRFVFDHLNYIGVTNSKCRA